MVFESVVEKIVIGGYNDEGVEEPLKITFVYKTGIHSNFNGKDFKPKRKNAAAVHNDAELCSYTSDEAEKEHGDPDAADWHKGGGSPSAFRCEYSGRCIVRRWEHEKRRSEK